MGPNHPRIISYYPNSRKTAICRDLKYPLPAHCSKMTGTKGGRYLKGKAGWKLAVEAIGKVIVLQKFEVRRAK